MDTKHTRMNQSNNIDIIYMTLFPWNNEYSSVSLSFTKMASFFCAYKKTVWMKNKNTKIGFIKMKLKGFMCVFSFDKDTQNLA